MKIQTIISSLMLILPLFGGNSSVCYAGDGFESVRCGADIRKALLGKKGSNERVVVIEEKHKDLGLKDLGASEISDRLTLISWLICGDEYAVLEDQGGIVRDVL